MHAVDKTKSFETRQSRSLDGGVTWDDSVLMPAESGGRGVSSDEHMQTGSNLRCDEAIADGTLVLKDCPGDVPFTHPEFCMMLAKTGLSEGCKSFYYYSIDKCHSWEGVRHLLSRMQSIDILIVVSSHYPDGFLSLVCDEER
jgi:hypothetical protein